MKALITGACGQDGWYLAELLLSKGYEVLGGFRGNLEPGAMPCGVRSVYCDVTDTQAVRSVIQREMPAEVYNLAAITNVGDSFHAPAAALLHNALGAVNVGSAAADIGAKFYQASTSELFGNSPAPHNEQTPMAPRSPYAVAKLAAYWSTRNLRERGAFAVNGILFNHESARRGGGFVTQKVARGVAAIRKGRASKLTLGNLDAERDWGHAKDYVRGMWMLLQQERPDDYVLATGTTRSIRELCRVAFAHVGLDWTAYVETSEQHRRPLEVNKLCGDASKARALGWVPEIGFEQMIGEMVDAAMVAQ